MGDGVSPYQLTKAKRVLDAARRELGADLGGFSPVDLLLDQDVAATVDEARAILAELKRRERNAARRGRYQAMRDLGMVRTPYGWE